LQEAIIIEQIEAHAQFAEGTLAGAGQGIPQAHGEASAGKQKRKGNANGACSRNRYRACHRFCPVSA
jgi:hypothetical protein